MKPTKPGEGRLPLGRTAPFKARTAAARWHGKDPWETRAVAVWAVRFPRERPSPWMPTYARFVCTDLVVRRTRDASARSPATAGHAGHPMARLPTSRAARHQAFRQRYGDGAPGSVWNPTLHGAKF